jgi:large subunit ribosomal protein L21
MEHVMYAVFESGGKQHRIQKGDVIRVEKLAAEAGDTLSFDQVLLVGEGDSVQVGAPFVKGAQVVVEVVSQGRGKKITVIKFKRRKNYRRKQGHRQDYTAIKVVDIKAA